MHVPEEPTPEHIERFAKHTRLMLIRLRDIAGCEGLPLATVEDWIRRGKRGRPEDAACVQLVQAMEKAEADAGQRGYRRIQKAADEGSVKAAEWLAKHQPPSVSPPGRRRAKPSAQTA
jgi:hypothetical protein